MNFRIYDTPEVPARLSRIEPTPNSIAYRRARGHVPEDAHDASIILGIFIYIAST